MTLDTTAIKDIAQDTNALKQAWAQIDINSCPRTYNFHMHTKCSDGKLTPLESIEQAIEIGLRGMAITDHHTTRGYQTAREWLDRQPSTANLPHLWTGIEITSSLNWTEVHILGYGFNPEHSSLKPYLWGIRPFGSYAQAGRVINALHDAGGLVVLAHPARYRRPASELIPAAAALGVDGVEAYYAYGNPKPWQASSKETKEVVELAQKYELMTTCGTDTHGHSLLHRI
jgi:predicted metal-dependent phosphoesterase TrpH